MVRIVPFFGVRVVRRWGSRCRGSGEDALSPSTVADTGVTLNQVLDCAVDHGLIAIQPAKRVKPPRVPKSNGRHLGAADAQRLVAACSGARYGVVVAMLFMKGWRVSEALGLAWSDLDLDGERLDLVFTTEDGGIVARQHVDKLARSKAETQQLGAPIDEYSVRAMLA